MTTTEDRKVTVRAFPAEWQGRWSAAHARIDHAGYGDLVASAYRSAGPIVATRSGPAEAIRLGETVSLVAIRAGRRAACLLIDGALHAAEAARDSSELVSWLELIDDIARRAPKVLSAFLQNGSQVLDRLGFAGLAAFARMGLDLGRDDARRLAFFSLQSPEARQLLERRHPSASLPGLLPGLKPYLRALWAISPPIAEAPGDAPEAMRRRAGFGGGGIRLPPSYAGFPASDQKQLHRATLAHIGAHHCFTRKKFLATGLKPLQLALVSLIEDARVERQAVREMPGLFALWRGFHVARPEGAPVAITLMARLARALLDPSYEDPHGWVSKGRALFEDAAAVDIGSQQLSRHVGGLLGNDIGQMRLQFDAKSYVVQPAYRDDGMGLWDFGDDNPEVPYEMQASAEGARLEQRDSDDGRPEPDTIPDDSSGRAIMVEANEDVAVARYPEFDYVTGRERPDWCTVREPAVPMLSPAALHRAIEQRADLANRLTAIIRSSKVSRQQRVRRQAEGEFLDMDAAIEAAVAQRSGQIPEDRLYGRYERRHRDLAILVLIDTSASTGERISGRSETVLETERLSVAMLARAMVELGDPFALAAFSSNTRDNIGYQRIKDFAGRYDAAAEGRLAGLQSHHSTRLGAVIRHAGKDLKRQLSYRRLLLIITDGEPHDIDVDDRRHLVEDARAAVHELRNDGIDVFSIVLDSEAESYATRIFRRQNCVQLKSIDTLPEKLPGLLLRLAIQ
ncbi:VWA domain-containing protein [Bosea sp. NPDC055332]